MTSPVPVYPLSFAAAWGEPLATVSFKALPEDFAVSEVFTPECSGEGEHLLWLTRRSGMSTQELLTLIANTYGIPLRSLSVCGQKDKQALATQWVGLHVGIKQDPDPARLAAAGVEVLQEERHRRKLRHGAHRGNHFRIRLRDWQGDWDALMARCARISRAGVPHYFGPQRFGMRGDNVERAAAWFAGQERPRGRFLQGMLLSASRAWLFNTLLSRRVEEGTWNTCLSGDLLNLDGSQSWFRPDEHDPALSERLAQLDIHPTGPLWGRGALPSTGQVLALEKTLAEQFPALCAGLEGKGLDQERRALRMKVTDMHVEPVEQDSLMIEFSLGRGGYATTVLKELFTFT